MTHNCKTILQPPLVAVESCVLPDRKTSDGSKQTVVGQRDTIVLKLIADIPGISQSRIRAKIGVSDTTVSKTLIQLVDLGKIELAPRPLQSHSQQKHYRIKEFLQ